MQKPIDGGNAQTANGIHFAFLASSKQEVDKFHAAGLAAGAVDDGQPGPRTEYTEAYYGAFLRDLEGHKIEAMYWDFSKAPVSAAWVRKGLLMRKSERLLQLLVLLRGRRRASTANELANRLQVSERTIYRDIQSLLLSGVDIAGEAGVGYCLQPGSGIPPLMFNEKELEALVPGIRLVKGWADDELCAAASTAQDKIRAVLPPQTQQAHEHKLTRYLVPDYHRQAHVKFIEIVRSGIDSGTVLEIEYSDENNKASTALQMPGRLRNHLARRKAVASKTTYSNLGQKFQLASGISSKQEI